MANFQQRVQIVPPDGFGKLLLNSQFSIHNVPSCEL
jgi:hypothetical protein